MHGLLCSAACTSVVTDIHHHSKDTLEAHIEFLSSAEWTNELKHLLADLSDTRDGHTSTHARWQMSSEIAWGKVSAPDFRRMVTFI